MKKILIAILLLITVVSCTKENVNARLANDKTPKELLMGKWYFNNPAIWWYEFTPTRLNKNVGSTHQNIVGLNDSIVYIERLGYTPGYTEVRYKINGDTLWYGQGGGYYLRFKN